MVWVNPENSTTTSTNKNYGLVPKKVWVSTLKVYVLLNHGCRVINRTYLILAPLRFYGKNKFLFLIF